MADLPRTFREEVNGSEPGMPPLDLLFGRSAAMAAVRRTLQAVAKTEVPVLIQGESGTGKEVCARLLHRLSGRAGGDLVKVSCPAIPQGLLETELFGYERGAFTGAHSTKKGRVEQADKGTLLLDEVGSLDMAVQSKLLQLLQDGRFMRVGGHETRGIHTRLISIANRDLQEQVDEGTFRLDLLYRINALPIHLPPLRKRIEDLPDLTAYFLDRHAEAFGIEIPKISQRVISLMSRYRWPGNIRQLDNLIRSYVLIGSEEVLVDALVPEGSVDRGVLADVDVSLPLSLKVITKRATADLERQIILKVLKANRWNRLKTAKWLGISYRSLLYKLSEVGPEEVVRTAHPQVKQGPAAGSSSPAMLRAVGPQLG